MLVSKKKERGFTLIEVAVVLVIVGFLVGSFIGSITSRIETTRRDNAAKQLADIKTAIIGHAMAFGRLPCPATANSNGQESPVGGVTNCTRQYGFVPGSTLGLSGSYNKDNLLTDSWGNPFRYSVASANGGNFDFTKPGRIQVVGMGALSPELAVCHSYLPITPIKCESSPSINNTIVDGIPFIILSLGKDGSDFSAATAPNSDQGENAGEALVTANAAGENIAYTVGSNRFFVSKNYSAVDSSAGQYDDIVVWVSKYVLYSRMIEAGQFP